MSQSVKCSSSPRSLRRESKIDYDAEQTLFGQVTVFKKWLGLIHSKSIHHEEYYTPIPYELIDSAASFIASLMHGISSDLILMTTNLIETRSYRENVNFIRKTLTKAQVSCPSLICSLWYIDQFYRKPWFRTQWNLKDLFLASIVVADKYIADATWINSDWAEWTHFTYSTDKINQLEKRFLRDLDYKLYIPEVSYSNFVSYLEFRLHSRQLLGDNVLLLSYRNIDVLSQSLNPIYVKRLQLNLRPFEAMILLVKQSIYILAMYATALATIASTGYILLHSNIQEFFNMLLKGREDDIAMVVLTGIEFYKVELSTTVPTSTLRSATKPPYHANSSLIKA
ncbi:hypothetical protein BDF20DRAFT_912527 [Mycotypha africana]|uniref:uncharacterized protein n=1 Tax=Mycotypha africana TaxID=64632 RepID=UPI002300E4F7|nr:uncharacterized protein BDF20DRAFT_912527 [Mycotypha africana]KAI8982354.1 hypothetical protein BDF20DRAFT_912527 [Mycotypha africana]